MKKNLTTGIWVLAGAAALHVAFTACGSDSAANAGVDAAAVPCPASGLVERRYDASIGDLLSIRVGVEHADHSEIDVVVPKFVTPYGTLHVQCEP